MVGGSLIATCVAGSAPARAARASSLSCRMFLARDCFGVSSARIFTLFTSPLTPTMEYTSVTSGIFRNRASASLARCADSSSDALSGSLRSAIICAWSSTAMNSLPRFLAATRESASVAAVMPTVVHLWASTQARMRS